MLIGKLLDKHEQGVPPSSVLLKMSSGISLGFFFGGGGVGIVHFWPPHICKMTSATANNENLMILCKVV